MSKAPKKETAIASTFKQAVTALKKRYTDVVRVIDDALASENLKDRIWAVEQILRRVKPEEDAPARTRTKKQLVTEPDPSTLSDEELMARIEAYLHDAPLN